MMVSSLPRPGLFHRLAMAFNRQEPAVAQDLVDDIEQEEARSRIEFILDRFNENHGAFASELDMQSMMYFYPDRF